jgi:hypothetical protein
MGSPWISINGLMLDRIIVEGSQQTLMARLAAPP